MKPGWRELEEGGKILNAGNSAEHKTGDWRTFRPVLKEEVKCTHCMFCWIYCPEGCIEAKDGKRADILLDYCKGCGICAKICPVKAIEMKDENEFK